MPESNHPSLLDLPVELVEWIASYLTFQDVRHVRLACKSLQACTNSSFGRVAFSERVFLLADPASMQTLYDISIHPIYSHWVKCIRLSLATLQGDHGDWWQRECTLKSPQTRHDRLEHRNYRRQYQSLVREQLAFKGLVCASLLTSIFQNFVKAGNTPGITAVGNDFDGEFWPWGHGKLAQSLGYKKWAVDMPRGYRKDALAYYVIVSAATAADFPLQSLELGHVYNGVPPRLFCLFNNSNTDLSSLKTLKLTLSPEGEYTSSCRGYDASGTPEMTSKIEHMAHFFFFLISAPNLETLSLTIDGEGIPQGFHALTFYVLATNLYGVLVPRLRELELCGHQIRLKELLRFIGDRKTTLQRLKLTRVRDYGKDYGNRRLPRMLETIGGAGKQIRQVEVIDSYNGDAWVPGSARRSGLYPSDA